ncbi:MAG: response regulator [Thiovulaceae bacterium]|nr:response regulator [Sulfurimonadaceae bacterium]
MGIDTKELQTLTKKLNILFVEDDAIVRKLTHQILDVFFKDLTVTENGQEGLDAYKHSLDENQENFDIVITDVSMPKLSGIEMAQQILEMNPHQHFIFLSAHQDNDYAKELNDKGYFTSTTKPITLDSLKLVFQQSCLQLQDKGLV